MKKAVILFCICSILFFSCKKENVNSGDFSVLTYNVAGLPQGFNADQFPVLHMSDVGKQINNVDIVQVQEDFCYHDRLVVQNYAHPFVTPTKGCVPNGDGLNTFSIYPINDLFRQKWNACNGFDCLTPKGFSFTRIAINKKVSIHFYNVHANAGSDNADMAARRNNIVQLMRYIQTHSENMPVIVMGDFNSRYTRMGDTIGLFYDNGFKDVWIEKIRNGVIPPKGASLMDCTGDKSNLECEVVDKIFYRSSADIELTPTFYKLDDSLYYDKNGGPLSDHNPLFARFHFERK